MLDTNMVSYIIKGRHPEVRQRLAQHVPQEVVVSVITQAELFYGLAKLGNPINLSKLVREFLLRVKVLAWDEPVATSYARLRSRCSSSGISLGTMDMLIAAHAAAANAVLITHDAALKRIPSAELTIDDWVATPCL